MSDVKEVKRYIPDNTPIYLVGESTPEPTTCVVFGRDHDRIVAELKNEMAAIRAQGYNDWRMDLKRANETIDELRAEVVKARSSFTNSEAEIFNLKKQIATQARVIARAVKALNEYRCSSCLNRDELNCYRYEACSSYKELAAIEKEGAKDE